MKDINYVAELVLIDFADSLDDHIISLYTRSIRDSLFDT